MSNVRDDLNGRYLPDHGMYQARIYYIWESMKARCDRTYCNGYESYGGAGITYCDEWKTFSNFYRDMAEGYDDNLTLDRIDSTGNYCPDNCRWATTKQQARNTKANRLEEIGGVTLCVNDWRHIFGFPISTIYNRLYRGDRGYDLIRPVGVKKDTGSDYGIGDLSENAAVKEALREYL